MFNMSYMALQDLVEEANERGNIDFSRDVKNMIDEAKMENLISPTESDSLILELEVDYDEELFEDRGTDFDPENDSVDGFNFHYVDENEPNTSKFRDMYEEEGEDVVAGVNIDFFDEEDDCEEGYESAERVGDFHKDSEDYEGIDFSQIYDEDDEIY